MHKLHAIMLNVAPWQISIICGSVWHVNCCKMCLTCPLCPLHSVWHLICKKTCTQQGSPMCMHSTRKSMHDMRFEFTVSVCTSSMLCNLNAHVHTRNEQHKMSNVQCDKSIAQCASVYYAMWHVCSTMCNAKCPLCNDTCAIVHCAMWHVCSTMCNAKCSLCNDTCALCNVTCV